MRQPLSRRVLHVVKDSFPDRPALDVAVSRALLLRAATGAVPETIRVNRPGPIVTFGRQDASDPGYPAAVEAARAGGFEAVLRLAGGRAAVFHEDTVALARAVPDRNPAARTYARFEEMAEIVRAVLGRLGVDARVGEVPGEYCPGAYSVNARGRKKLVGMGQRLVRGAAHVGGVVVVSGSERVRQILVPVYSALGLEWDPATVGSIEDEVGRAGYEQTEQAIVEELGARYELVETALDEETLALASQLEPEHQAPPSAGGGGRAYPEGVSGTPR
jgi:octanoyl-[GcvH]:protein N-octanoyltransferase